jgi:hypothetical protein
MKDELKVETEVEIERDISSDEIKMFPYSCELCVHAERDIRTSRACAECLLAIKKPFPHFKPRQRQRRK